MVRSMAEVPEQRVHLTSYGCNTTISLLLVATKGNTQSSLLKFAFGVTEWSRARMAIPATRLGADFHNPSVLPHTHSVVDARLVTPCSEVVTPSRKSLKTQQAQRPHKQAAGSKGYRDHVRAPGRRYKSVLS